MRRVLVVLVVIVALLAIAAGAWAATTEPLSFGSAGGPGPGPLLTNEPNPDDEHMAAYTFLEQPGATFAVMVSLRNDGPLPVTILGTGDPKNQRLRNGFWREDLVLIPPDASIDDLKALVDAPALTALELQPGTEANLWARYRVSSKCDDGIVPRAAGSTISTDHLQLEWQMLGVTRHSSMPMRIRVGTTNPGPGDIPCPGPAGDPANPATSPAPAASPAG